MATGTSRYLWLIVPMTIFASSLVGFADEAPAARRYMDQLNGVIDQIATDLPSIWKSAQAAAVPFVDGCDLGVRGDAALGRELANRAGGLMACHGTIGAAGDVILYAFAVPARERPDLALALEQELADARKLAESGAVVVGIASFQMLRQHGQLVQVKQSCPLLLDNHVPVGADLLVTPVNAVVAWTWTAELFAACTRLGHVPVLRRHHDVDYKRQWYRRYRDMRFHDDVELGRIDRGVLGAEYLASLRGILRDVGTASWRARPKPEMP